MTCTPAQLQAVVDSAHDLLDKRRTAMDTTEEWVALARAVAACTGRLASDLLTTRDLENVAEYGLPWDEAVDGPLPDED
jgi:hypothetical protein